MNTNLEAAATPPVALAATTGATPSPGHAVAYVTERLPAPVGNVHRARDPPARAHRPARTATSVKREDEAQVHPVVGQIHAPLVYLPPATSLSGSTLTGWLLKNLPTFHGARRPRSRCAIRCATRARWRPRSR